jgi:hypothetical protein
LTRDGVLLRQLLEPHGLPGQGQGIQQLPTYYERTRIGIVDVEARVEIMSRAGGVALVNAHRGLGSVAATKAMSLAVELCREQGIGAVGVRDSTHFGIAAYYAMLALPHDFIGIAFSNAGPYPGAGYQRGLRPGSALRRRRSRTCSGCSRRSIHSRPPDPDRRLADAAGGLDVDHQI